MTELECSSCSGEMQISCRSNYEEMTRVLNDGVDQTMAGDWKEVTIDSNGDITLSSLNPFDPGAIKAHTVLRGMFIEGLFEAQRQLGCNLSRDNVEMKLTLGKEA